MSEENNEKELHKPTSPRTNENALVSTQVNSVSLNKESLEIINQIIAETDIGKTKDLTYLFNINQTKKTIVRTNKLNELLDALTDEAIIRVTTRPDELSNTELFGSLKTVQDLIERGQKQVNGADEKPLIQINQQDNSVNLGDTPNKMTREQRSRIKDAILAVLSSASTVDGSTVIEADIIDPKKEEE